MSRSFRVLAPTVLALAASAIATPTGAQFVCESESIVPAAISPSDTLVEARAVFITFDGLTDELPAWADSFVVQLPRYFETMSRGKHRMNLEIVRRPGLPSKAWVAPSPPLDTSYVMSNAAYIYTNGIMLYLIEQEIEDVWDGVEYVFALHYVHTLGCSDPSSVSDCSATGDGPVGIAALEGGGHSFVGSTQVLFPPAYYDALNGASATYIAAHEYGHVLGLNHSPSTTFDPNLNMGRYDIMRANASGIRAEGLVPYHPLQLLELGWVRDSVIADNTVDLTIPDLLSGEGMIFRVPTPDTLETFVLANWQGSSEFDAKYAGTGLHVWHVLKSPGGSILSWDLESAVGRFTSGVRDPASGKDPLEAASSHLGSGNDFYVNGGNEECACGTNPSTALYSGASYTSSQDDSSSIAFENIREDQSGNIVLNVFLNPQQFLGFPGAGDTAAVDLPNLITWATRDSACIDTVVGLLSDDNGSSFDTLFVDVANSGSYSWTPTVIDSAYVVRLISRDKTNATGISESGTFRVADRVAPSSITNLLVEFVSQTSVGLTWTAPGDDASSGTATEYDIRRSTSPITEANWHSATKLTNEDPPSGAGEDEMLWVQNLSPCTTYYFAIKTRDESHNWSALGTAEGQSTLCGGGFAAGPASDERSAEPSAVTAVPQNQLVLELHVTDGTPRWTLTGHDHTSLDGGRLLSGGIHVQVPDGLGGWQSRAHLVTPGSDSRFGLRVPNRAATRVIFSGDFDIEYVAGRVINRVGDVVEVDGVQSSRLGDMSEDVSGDDGGSPEHEPGDTLTVNYAPTESTEGEQVLLMVGGRIAGGAGESSGIRSQEPTLPTSFSLAQNQPNPFSAATMFRFDLPTSERVLLEVFDLQGRRLATLASGRFEAGSHSVEWQPRSLGTRIKPGVYLYRFSAGPFTSQRKFVLLP